MHKINFIVDDEEYDFLKSRSISATAWLRWVIQKGIRLEKQESISASASITEEKE